MTPSHSPPPLLDASVLIAMAAEDHVHHSAAEAWVAAQGQGFATCPITQASLVRFIVRSGETGLDATRFVQGLVDRHDHTFLADSLGYGDVDLSGVVGHRQVTDAYLAALAASNGVPLATFDRGLAALRPKVTVLVPT